MQITNVRVKLVKNVDTSGRLRALVSITLDDEFAIHNIKVIEGEDGLFVAMPAERWERVSFVILYIRFMHRQERNCIVALSTNTWKYEMRRFHEYRRHC